MDASFPLEPSTSSSSFPSSLHQRTSSTYQPASPRSPSSYMPTGPFLIKTQPPPDVNKNTSWILYPGIWTMYFVLVFLVWLLVLSILGCSVGTAWTLVHLIHSTVTFYLFHWKKGSPFSEDQGMYDKLTWWEQVDNGRQLTRSRKFLTFVPVLLYAIASYTMRTSQYSNAVLLVNTVVVFTVIIAKMPFLHQVRIFGINAGFAT